MLNVFDVLAKDHEEVRRMLSELELGPTAATGATADQLALRQKMVEQLVIEESKHEAVEEMYFWPVVRSHLTDGDDLADQAQDQEQQGKFILDRLDKVIPEDEEFEDQRPTSVASWPKPSSRRPPGRTRTPRPQPACSRSRARPSRRQTASATPSPAATNSPTSGENPRSVQNKDF
jgi:hypothetical protein